MRVDWAALGLTRRGRIPAFPVPTALKDQTPYSGLHSDATESY